MTRQNTRAATHQAARKRLTGACKACHDRKVRCSLAKSGPPCTNCSLDEVECELRARKSHKTSSATATSHQLLPRSLDSPGDVDQRESSITVVTPQLDSQLGTSDCHSATPSTDNTSKPDSEPKDRGNAHATLPDSVVHSEKASKSSSSHFQPFRSHFSHFEEDDALNADALLADTPIYADPKGVCAIANICEPDSAEKSGHFLLPNGIVSLLDPDDLEYLQRKGVFAFPEPQVRDDLVRTYFHYVHPFLPILDAQDFLSQHESAALDKIGPHLLWSMYLAACNFVEEDVVRRAGFPTRKKMKRSIYRKAKVLYDMQYERDRTTLIQAVLLMSFCSSDTEDKTGPWHWIGVAIGLCQTAGLHRNPDSAASHIPQQHQRLWRLIWWSCVHQDVWFSVGMGRPMRINLDDCDTQLPTTGDFYAMSAGVPDTLREKYLPSAMGNLSQLFLELIRLAIAQTNILSKHYRIRQMQPNAADVADIEQQISAIHDKVGCFRYSEDRTVCYHAYHLELFLQSVRIVLYRPYVQSLCQKPPPSISQEWGLLMERKARTAAAGFNQTLEALINEDMISTCQGPVCIALAPPMQVHLLNSTSGKPLIATMGRHSLDMCMLVADELRKTYFGAELVYRIFSLAKIQINNRKSRQPSTNDSPAAGNTNLQNSMPHSSHGTTEGTNAMTNPDSTFTGFEGILDGYESVHSRFALYPLCKY
ncbi:putative Zn(II)2Cys6 transcription factor [Ilyonectria destructans]|nr:putative Zn(II)2Cys6 transcription factor [Ilyonectria destructans]